MILQPSKKSDLAEALRRAHEQRQPVQGVDLCMLQRIVQHTPEDMTVTVEAGITLAALQSTLGRRGQWLPIDPPDADRLTIGELLATNASGPRRFGFGTIRDHLIGLEAILADGRLIHSGGKVVKNVAGFDLMKLFVGGRHSLGFIVEATFKLLPLPEAEQSVQARCESPAAAGRLIDAIVESELTPVVLDLHCGMDVNADRHHHLLLTFAGPAEDVAQQLAQAAALGINEPVSNDPEKAFWATTRSAPKCLSVLPSRVIAAIESLGGAEYVARAGNGVIYHRGEVPPPSTELPHSLLRRVKEVFDPNSILPPMPAQ
jgi:glycolate oxidase FAD binding subunit